MSVPRIDKLIGLGVYATETAGTGGAIRESVEDFAVEEVLVDGSKAKIEKSAGRHVLGANESKQRYLLCVLVKRNWDTFIALRKIAKQLGITQGQIRIAGIKDAKAITAQHITIEDGSMEDASKVNIKDIEIRPVGYVRDRLSPYYLLGNHFAIRVKSLKLSESTVAKRITETITALDVIGGIPNFFGHQRFGTTRPITHLVGKAIAEGDFEKAAMLFLAKPSVQEHPSSRDARAELQSTHDFKWAFENFPKQLRFEKLMLGHLIERPGDFVGAFRRLPVKLQVLFVQAYQSYLFNRFLSERIRNGFSLNNVEVGDHVVHVERSGLPMMHTAKIASNKDLSEANELVKAGRMRVALPLIGTKQKLSRGVMGQIERQVLEEERVETSDFRIRAMPEMIRRGGLRAIVAPVRSFEIDCAVSAADKSEHLVCLGFMLLRGSYATVLLREIMKPSDPIKAGF